jgi:hypothetical protein
LESELSPTKPTPQLAPNYQPLTSLDPKKSSLTAKFSKTLAYLFTFVLPVPLFQFLY